MSKTNKILQEIILKKVWMRYDGSKLVEYSGTRNFPEKKSFTATILFDKSNKEQMAQLKELTEITRVIKEEALKGKRVNFSIPIYDNSNLPDNFIPEPEELENYYRLTLKAKARQDTPESIDTIRPPIFDRFGQQMPRSFIIPPGACVTVKIRWYLYDSVKIGMTFVPMSFLYFDNVDPITIPNSCSGYINPEQERQALAQFFEEQKEQKEMEMEDIII